MFGRQTTASATTNGATWPTWSAFNPMANRRQHATSGHGYGGTHRPAVNCVSWLRSILTCGGCISSVQLTKRPVGLCWAPLKPRPPTTNRPRWHPVSDQCLSMLCGAPKHQPFKSMQRAQGIGHLYSSPSHTHTYTSTHSQRYTPDHTPGVQLHPPQNCHCKHA